MNNAPNTTPRTNAPLRGNIKRQFEQMRERSRQLETELNEVKRREEELLAENVSMLARMDECGYPEMLAKQNELMKIAEELAQDATIFDNYPCNCQRCRARAKLTAFKEGMK